MAAPKGNNNAGKGKMWEGAVRRTLAEEREALNEIAKAVVSAAKKGEAWAVTEIRNTLDGKPKEHVHVEQNVTFNVGDTTGLETRLDGVLSRRTGDPVREKPPY